MVQLLAVLNERAAVGRGPEAAGFTIDQLYAEIASAPATAAGGKTPDWTGLRKLLATARASGILAIVTEQVIDDFAVVFSLNAKQLLSLKDIVLGAKEDRR